MEIFTSIQPKSFLVGWNIERLLTSPPPELFSRGSKAIMCHGCTAIRRNLVDEANAIFWLLQKSFKFRYCSHEAANYTISAFFFFLPLTCIYHIWNKFTFSTGKIKNSYFAIFWDT